MHPRYKLARVWARLALMALSSIEWKIKHPTIYTSYDVLAECNLWLYRRNYAASIYRSTNNE